MVQSHIWICKDKNCMEEFNEWKKCKDHLQRTKHCIHVTNLYDHCMTAISAKVVNNKDNDKSKGKGSSGGESRANQEVNESGNESICELNHEISIQGPTFAEIIQLKDDDMKPNDTKFELGNLIVDSDFDLNDYDEQLYEDVWRSSVLDFDDAFLHLKSKS